MSRELEASETLRPERLAELVFDLLRCVGAGVHYGKELPPDDVVYLAAKRIDSLALVGQLQCPRQSLYEKVFAAQTAAVRGVVAAFEANGIAPLVTKGGELLHRFFQGHALNILEDFDLLIQRQQVPECKGALLDLGFRQARLDRTLPSLVDIDYAEIASAEASHYELHPFRRLTELELTSEERAIAGAMKPGQVIPSGDRSWLLIELDIHVAVAIDVPAEPFFRRAIPSSLGIGRTLCNADHLWFIASRYYAEVALHGKRTLRDLAYLVAIVSRGDIDWEVVVEAAESLELRPSLFYWLSCFPAWTGLAEKVPRAVLTALDPRRGSRLRDWGFQLGPLFDTLEPSAGFEAALYQAARRPEARGG